MHRLTAQFDGQEITYQEKEKADPLAGLICYRVKADKDSPYWRANPRPGLTRTNAKGVPAVSPASPTPEWPDTSRCDMTEPWQLFGADLFALAKYGKVYEDLTNSKRLYIANKYTNTMGDDKFISDGSGMHGNRNYLLNTNMNKGYPRQESKIITGQFVYSFDYWPIVENDDGVRMVRLFSFLRSQTPPKPDLADPRVIIAMVVKRNGTYGQFPQLGVPLPYAFLTEGPAYYPEPELEKV